VIQPIQKSLSITMCYVDMNEKDIDTTRENEGSSEETHQDEDEEDIETPVLNVQHFRTGMIIQNHKTDLRSSTSTSSM
jgi:hypothetical protein